MKTVKNSYAEDMQHKAKKAVSMLKLLANEHRLMLLCHLQQGEKTVSELTELVGLSQSALSQHLAKLRLCGFVTDHKKGQSVYYQIDHPDLEAVLSTLYELYCNDSRI